MSAQGRITGSGFDLRFYSFSLPTSSHSSHCHSGKQSDLFKNKLGYVILLLFCGCNTLPDVSISRTLPHTSFFTRYAPVLLAAWDWEPQNHLQRQLFMWESFIRECSRKNQQKSEEVATGKEEKASEGEKSNKVPVRTTLALSCKGEVGDRVWGDDPIRAKELGNLYSFTHQSLVKGCPGAWTFLELPILGTCSQSEFWQPEEALQQRCRYC